ncbi:SMAD/FHA domain-containing protein [Lentinula raphanica]|uniref:SMAD/FHA domain-containing protein n=1 Tax=Lentinula raphanica TaxID=153919 RepID=A0AA38PCE5_9AGAR|nr:SMAD/FHA domain-containing protein [Lentinula raphanica]
MPGKTLKLIPTESSLFFTPKQIQLEPGSSVILGRQGIYATSEEASPSNGWFLTPDGVFSSVSKQHASVWVDTRGRVFIQDLNSSNGTYINGLGLAAGQAKQLKTGEILVHRYAYSMRT